MKTAVSIPDEVFREAERYARRTKESRSALYSKAVAEYLARHVPDSVTEAMDKLCEELGQPEDPFAVQAGRRVLERTPW